MHRTTGVLVAFLLSVLACRAEAGIVPIGGMAPDGRTYEDLAAAWWQWALSIPADLNPMLDYDGQNGAVGQQGEVWFLAPSLGGDYTRHVMVPEGKCLFFPVVTSIVLNGPGEYYTDADMRDQLHDFLGRTSILYAKVDDEQVLDLWTYRVSSAAGGFELTVPEDGIYGDELPAGVYPPPAVADGWWLLLEPLSRGHHAIRFGGGTGMPNGDLSYMQRTEYFIDVVPEPAAIGLLAVAGLLLQRRNRQPALRRS